MGVLDWLTSAIGGSGPMPPVQGFDMNRPMGPMPPAQGLDVRPQQLAMPPAQGLDLPRPQPPMPPQSGQPSGPMPPMQGLDLPPPQQPPMPPVQAMDDVPPRPPGPMPPAQGLEMNGSPVQMTGEDAARLPPPAQPQIPMPRPRPPGADAAIPPSAQPTQGAAPPGQPLNIAPQPGAAPAPQQGGGMPSLTRALGLDQGTSDKIRSGLSAGLKAAGNSAGKSPFQAFASGAGEGLGGQEARQDKTYDQKLKYLQAAIAAKSSGDKAEYNKNYAAYLTGKLKADTDKAASAEGGKKGAWNKPDSQKFIDAQHALSNDPEIRASQKLLEQTAKSGEPADVAKAQAQHQALIRDKEAKYLSGVGLNPQKLAELQKNPPGTRGNPHAVTSQQDFDQYVKPGDAYINPKDGKLYIRKGGGASSDSPAVAGGSAPAAPASPSSPPEPPGPAPGLKTDDDD